jgi:hypothetical protein
MRIDTGCIWHQEMKHMDRGYEKYMWLAIGVLIGAIVVLVSSPPTEVTDKDVVITSLQLARHALNESIEKQDEAARAWYELDKMRLFMMSHTNYSQKDVDAWDGVLLRGSGIITWNEVPR